MGSNLRSQVQATSRRVVSPTTLNTSGAIVSTGKVTVNNVLAITGYADVKLAIDGKQYAHRFE
jgi:hypothetical protein